MYKRQEYVIAHGAVAENQKIKILVVGGQRDSICEVRHRFTNHRLVTGINGTVTRIIPEYGIALVIQMIDLIASEIPHRIARCV